MVKRKKMAYTKYKGVSMFFFRFPLKKLQEKRDFILLLIHIHLLVFAFSGVLWARSQLRNKQAAFSSSSLQEKSERNARVLFKETSPSDQTDSSR